MKKITCFLALSFLLFSFCNNDDPAPKVEVMDILIDGDWTHTSYKTDGNNDGTFEEASLPCQIGDVWRFSADHAFQWRDETEFCDTDVDTVAIFPGVWQLANNDTEINLEVAGGLDEFNFKIQSIDNNRLELRAYNDLNNFPFRPAEERFYFER